jgi:monofunctional biosynthetic peptidoglycan transglycosylase
MREGKPAQWTKLIRRGLWLVPLGFAAWLWFVWPPPAWYRWMWPRETAFMAMRQREAKPLPRLYQPVPMDRIASIMGLAVLAGEDQRFYSHSGIDYIEFRHALGYRPDSFSWKDRRDRSQLWRAVRQGWARRGRIRGASTITQQLAKNLYLSPSRNPLRKLKEAVTAWRLEYWLGKERILELYLNVAELGPGIWGVEAASQKYFGHSAATLSLEEAAGLAGTLPFPLSSNLRLRPGRMRWRQGMIVRRLRGEAVVIPPVLDPPDLPPDTLRAAPDTSSDTLRVPRDSLDTLRARPDTVVDTLPASRPIAGASPASGSSPDRPNPLVRRLPRARGP